MQQCLKRAMRHPRWTLSGGQQNGELQMVDQSKSKSVVYLLTASATANLINETHRTASLTLLERDHQSSTSSSTPTALPLTQGGRPVCCRHLHLRQSGFGSRHGRSCQLRNRGPGGASVLGAVAGHPGYSGVGSLCQRGGFSWHPTHHPSRQPLHRPLCGGG
jgi:hypothetical protein